MKGTNPTRREVLLSRRAWYWLVRSQVPLLYCLRKRGLQVKRDKLPSGLVGGLYIKSGCEGSHRMARLARQLSDSHTSQNSVRQLFI